jgi:hypothetical protein
LSLTTSFYQLLSGRIFRKSARRLPESDCYFLSNALVEVCFPPA